MERGEASQTSLGVMREVKIMENANANFPRDSLEKKTTWKTPKRAMKGKFFVFRVKTTHLS